MQPLPVRTRRLYLFAFVALFFAILPVVIMYADGWRFKPGFGFVRTGGIFVSVPYPEATVSLNEDLIGTSGFLNRSFYIPDLAPSAYVVRVTREGYNQWDRVLVVEEQLVTDTRAFLIPTTVEPLLLTVGTATSGVSVVSRETYANYSAAFGTTTASTTIPQDESDGVGLFVLGGDLYARWMPAGAFPPSHFCGRPSFCTKEIVVERNEGTVRTARFFRGSAVYATSEGDVYFAEIDARQKPLTIKLFEARNADVRVVDDTLIVKSGSNLYQIPL